MKLRKSLFMLCAAGLSLCACNSDDIKEQMPEGYGAVTVKITNPATRSVINTASTGGVVNGDIILTLTHEAVSGTTVVSPQNITLEWDDVNSSYTNCTPDGDDLLVTFYNIGRPTKLEASMHGGIGNYSTVSIAQESGEGGNLQATPDQIPVYGFTETFTKSGNVINDGNKDYIEYDASVTMKIPVARLEIQVAISDEANAFAGFSSVKLAGAYLDNIKSVGGATDYTNYYLQYDNSATKKATGVGSDAYAILCDNYMTAEGELGTSAPVVFGTDAVSELPAAGFFAYNFYPGTAPKFNLCLKVEGDGENIPALQYAIVKFVDGDDNDLVFEAGNIYKVTNLSLKGDNIQVDEDGNDLTFALTAVVERASWTVKTDVEGTWE